MFVCVCICTRIYMHTERARERDREREKYYIEDMKQMKSTLSRSSIRTATLVHLETRR